MGAGASSRRETDDAARTSPAALQWQDATKLFREIDADADGTISSVELASVLEAHGYSAEVSATLTEELDIDKDGVISFAEWRSRFYRAASARSSSRPARISATSFPRRSRAAPSRMPNAHLSAPDEHFSPWLASGSRRIALVGTGMGPKS